MGYRTLKMTLNKAAGEKQPEAYRPSHPPCPEPAKTGSSLRYVEDCFEPRTQLGKGRVLARLGCGGCNQVILSDLR